MFELCAYNVCQDQNVCRQFCRLPQSKSHVWLASTITSQVLPSGKRKLNAVSIHQMIRVIEEEENRERENPVPGWISVSTGSGGSYRSSSGTSTTCYLLVYLYKQEGCLLCWGYLSCEEPVFYVWNCDCEDE